MDIGLSPKLATLRQCALMTIEVMKDHTPSFYSREAPRESLGLFGVAEASIVASARTTHKNLNIEAEAIGALDFWQKEDKLECRGNSEIDPGLFSLTDNSKEMDWFSIPLEEIQATR
ncbi:hypothetical protein Godav_009245 [Gossypium davidsonii]|uniref:Uncharacterized protein n=1 Tax=Gossypium davidsonii TaxID=34287 RepID=A0A7J8SE13_GOSDV|nr:hypothetical protein [Gossypium davidsonii]